MIEKINLVYFSAAGTTKAVSIHLAESMGREINEYDLLRQPPRQPVAFESDAPALFAMPVYAGRIPAVCADALRQFRGRNTPTIAVVTYGNRDFDDALLELKNILSENGFVVVAAAAVVAQHSIFPHVAIGRPDASDKQKIAAFGQTCSEALNGFTDAAKISVKGNTPYCKPMAIPLQPAGNARCNTCGACVKVCPTKAIMAESPRKTDKSRCIACTACIAACPQNARGFRGPLYAVAGKGFAAMTKTRKEPEFFTSNHQF